MLPSNEGYNLVKEFYLKQGQPLFNGHGVMPEEIYLLRACLLLEELGELAVGVQRRDPVLIADAAADLLYVTLGTAVSLTGPVPDCWGLNLKYQRPYLEALAEVSSRVNNLVCCLAKTRPVDTIKQSVISLMISLSVSLDLPLRELTLEVHRANMSKDVVDVTGGKKGAVKGASYVAPDIRSVLGV